MDFCKKDRPKESNEIANKELSDHIADTAISIMQKDADYENLAAQHLNSAIYLILRATALNPYSK